MKTPRPHGGARRGLKAKAKRKSVKKKILKRPARPFAYGTIQTPRTQALQPAEIKCPDLSIAGWRLAACRAHLINVPCDKDRRQASLHELKAIGFKWLEVVRGCIGHKCIKFVRKEGKFCVAHLTKAGVNLVGERTTLVRCTGAARAPHVFGCTRSHLAALHQAKRHALDKSQGAAAEYVALFEDDLQLSIPGKAINYLVSTLMRSAAIKPDILMLGAADCFGSFNKGKKPEHLKVASLRWQGADWTLVKYPGLLLAHAYLLKYDMIPLIAQLLEEGYSADGALSKASKSHFMAAVLKDGQLYQLVAQRPKAQTRPSRSD